MVKMKKKWTESLEQLHNENNPFVMDYCFRSSYAPALAKNFRSTNQVNLVLKDKAKIGKMYDLACAFDHLRRSNMRFNLNADSWNIAVKAICDIKHEGMAKVLEESVIPKNNKIKLTEENKKLLKETGDKMDFNLLYEWVFVKETKKKPQFVKDREQVMLDKTKVLFDSFNKIQPSFDQIPSIEERDI